MLQELNFDQWEGFRSGGWKHTIDVGSFIRKNYTPYYEDESFLADATPATKAVWEKCEALLWEEQQKGILGVETDLISGINNYEPGYIDKENEVIVGLQTDAPLKRIVNLYGGTRMAESALEQYGYKLNEQLMHDFKTYRKTHNEGVFDAYTPAIRLARNAGLLTGLPDAYGRGRIIGDYRRVALYGLDALVEDKKRDLSHLTENIDANRIQLREEVSMQIRALQEMGAMALRYGIDLSKPAKTAQEAIQFLYMAYLAGIKENNGAATSLGRTSTFVDIYIQRDLDRGLITEAQAQELVDQFIIKLRLVRHLRTPEYNELFGGDPTWVTEVIGGMTVRGTTMVTKSSFRYLHALTNLGPAPEPNMTVLWSEFLPQAFKEYCAKMSIQTDALQYENDDVMRPLYGDDYAIACCVSAMTIGKQMQFFGARCNIAKSLLYAINGGRDEIKGNVVIPGIEPITDDVLEYYKVRDNYEKVMDYVALMYADAINIIHYMHDKYAYEASQMALHSTKVERLAAFGIAGLSVAADSLSAIRYANVRPIRNEEGLAVDFEVDGDFPKYGNDDDRADDEAIFVTRYFSKELKKHPLYRDAHHTLSALTITSNVMYGKKTGSTPDGRKKGEALAPGANPMHGRDNSGALASLNSVAKIPYRGVCQDGVSNTFSIVPDALGHDEAGRKANLASILDGYFHQGAHHLNVNVLNREMLLDALDHPEKYPSLTIRVSGYAVHFNRLSREQREEVVRRTFHKSV
ncbi:formate C-acetyltransferase [Bengtsoniella intestinalis]|uniref:formate C-acetyltransferase n=1 Tax=Bengtsoniella intestinalis TaxID=3073143 RepID=UPI00391F9D9B